MKITRTQLREAIHAMVKKKLAESKPFDFGYVTPGQHGEKDPLVQLHGYGSMRLSQWKRKAVLTLEEALKKAKTDDFRSAQYYLKPDGILNNVIGLILEVDKRQKKLQELAPQQTNMYGMSSQTNPLDTTNKDGESQSTDTNDTEQMSPADQTAMTNAQSEQDKLTNDVRRLDGTITKLQEPITRKVKYLEVEKQKKQQKLGQATDKVQSIQAKYARKKL